MACRSRRVVALAAGVLAWPSGSPSAQESPPALRYAQPAARWIEALPVGNGRLGAMVFGGAPSERLQLNEDSCWSGGEQPDWQRGSPADLRRFRDELAAGHVVDVDRAVMGTFSAGRILRSHQTLGDLQLDFGELAAGDGYRRELDLRDGIARVWTTGGGSATSREVLASAPHDVLVMRVAARERGALAFDVALSRPPDRELPTAAVRGDAERGVLRMEGRVTQRGADWYREGDGMQFLVVAAVDVEGGWAEATDSVLRVRGADAATLWLAAATSYHGDDLDARCARTLAEARAAGWPAVRAAHVAEHRSWFDRVSLRLGDGPRDASTPTDRRLAAVRDGADDPDLAALLFQYGRYLLIGCSRPGTLPANLQGLWNEHIEAPWNADYHLNINLQMNYWPAEVTDLAELHGPLFEFLERLAARGRDRARESFGLRGFVTGHATDVWAPAFHRSTEPFWGFWHLGGAWLCAHVAEHWRFTGDDVWMRQRGWPLLRDCARFLLDWLVEDPVTGELVSGPSSSPENSYRLPDGQRAAVCMGPAMDQQIVAEVFGNALQVAGALGIDEPIVAELAAALPRLRDGVRVGSDGRVLEWDREYAEVEPGHRHMSHLYALFPGDRIDPHATPELAAAAARTIEQRLAHGGGGTGWSRAWLISFAARLHDGAQAGEHLQALLRKSMAPNLFDLHPPFQIDGNFGATAGIAELLLQSNHDVVEVLPALPPGWSSGAFTGLCARGGFQVDCAWDGGAFTTLTIRSKLGRELVLRHPAPLRIAVGEGFETHRPDAAGLHRIPTRPGQVLRFRPAS
ncbi:MAG: glycoside hydrolase N-terminal domain-containing protein [Planctomycetes bacterium]|nr:glycoside hydrolase N-terminal domain-containing protein [Planctomycetota bacterium]